MFRHHSGREKPNGFHSRWRRHHELHHNQYLRHYRYFRFFRPVGIVLSLFILYLLLSWVGIQETGIWLVVLFGIKEIAQFFFLLRLERRIFKPMEQLRQGLDEVSRGNFQVRVEYGRPNDLNLLIDAFNEMAGKLNEGEQLKKQYEENRKALIANISHDLKTPITVIQGHIEALLEGKVTAGNKTAYLKTVYNNIVYVNKLIDDLFLFAKLDMQKLGLNYEVLPIRAFMRDLMEEYQFNFAEQQVAFHYGDELDRDYRVKLDGKRMKQALNNIFSNAVQHGPDTGLSIQVRLYRQDGLAGIDIRDNGPGIQADKLSLIFERFYRIDTERTKDFANSGLGLAIARELVEAHGGTICVNSSGCEGTCFTIMLPLCELEAEGRMDNEAHSDH